MFLNSSIPPIKVFIRKEFLYNGEAHHGEFVSAILIGVKSIQNRALGFHVVTDFGGVFWNLPIHAICWLGKSSPRGLQELELWNCFSNTFSIKSFFFLEGRRCAYRTIQNHWSYGEYLFTIDWCSDDTGLDVSFAETPDESKCGHFIKLDNGNFALQPNNRLKFEDPSFITKPFPEKPDFKVNTHLWQTEHYWKTEDTDNFHYGIEEIKIRGTKEKDFYD